MKHFKTLAVSLLLSAVTTVQAAGAGQWSYLQNGHDWKYDTSSECHLPMQSPIDLKTEGIKKVSARKKLSLADGNVELNTKYENLNAKEVKVNGFTVQVDFKEQMDSNYFQTQIPVVEYQGPDKMNSLQFHFHAKSEHTIDGKQYDFEMHTVHLPPDYETRAGKTPPRVFASALGLMFDRVNYDPVTPAEEKIIDEFFYSLSLETDADIFTSDANIPFANLMNMVDLSNRWVYKGGLTTPPCTRVVFFQVVHRVLPISPRWYNAYLKHQAKIMNKYQYNPDGSVHEVTTPIGLDVTGNFRKPVPYTDDQGLLYLLPDGTPEPEQVMGGESLSTTNSRGSTNDPTTRDQGERTYKQDTSSIVLLAICNVCLIVIIIVMCIYFKGKAAKN